MNRKHSSACVEIYQKALLNYRNDINLMTLLDFRWTCLTIPFFIYLSCIGFCDNKKQHPEEFPSAVIYEDVFYC